MEYFYKIMYPINMITEKNNIKICHLPVFHMCHPHKSINSYIVISNNTFGK